MYNTMASWLACPGWTQLFALVGNRVKRKLIAAKQFVFRELPDLTQDIENLTNICNQYDARTRVLQNRALAARDAAARCVTEYKQTKNPATYQAALQHLNTKSVRVRFV